MLKINLRNAEVQLIACSNPSQVPPLLMHLGKWPAMLPATKRSACVAPEVDLWECTFTSAKKWIRQNPLWLWNPEETSPEIQQEIKDLWHIWSIWNLSIYLSIYLSISFAKIGLTCTENQPQMYGSASNVQINFFICLSICCPGEGVQLAVKSGRLARPGSATVARGLTCTENVHLRPICTFEANFLSVYLSIYLSALLKSASNVCTFEADRTLPGKGVRSSGQSCWFSRPIALQWPEDWTPSPSRVWSASNVRVTESNPRATVAPLSASLTDFMADCTP